MEKEPGVFRWAFGSPTEEDYHNLKFDLMAIAAMLICAAVYWTIPGWNLSPDEMLALRIYYWTTVLISFSAMLSISTSNLIGAIMAALTMGPILWPFFMVAADKNRRRKLKAD